MNIFDIEFTFVLFVIGATFAGVATAIHWGKSTP